MVLYFLLKCLLKCNVFMSTCNFLKPFSFTPLNTMFHIHTIVFNFLLKLQMLIEFYVAPEPLVKLLLSITVFFFSSSSVTFLHPQSCKLKRSQSKNHLITLSMNQSCLLKIDLKLRQQR